MDVSGFNTLIFSAVVPSSCRLELSVETDAGPRRLQAQALDLPLREYRLDLNGATRLTGIRASLVAEETGSAHGRLNFILVENKELLDRLQAQQKRYDGEWEGYLKPRGEALDFKPLNDVFLDETELEQLRRKLLSSDDERNRRELAAFREKAISIVPEDRMHGFMGPAYRFGRDRDIGKALNYEGSRMALAALLTKDETLLRHAARYGLVIAFTESWHPSFYSTLPGSFHDHRAFEHRLATEALAVIYALAGELYTDSARYFIERRLAYDGVGWTNYTTWRYPGIHQNNQLAAFASGRMAAYAVLGADMPRVMDYAEIAHRELMESLDRIILPGGAYEEGPKYFTYTVRNAAAAIFYYARLKGIPLHEAIPGSLLRSGSFAEALRSTLPSRDVIPVGDSDVLLHRQAVAFLAAILPESAWAQMYRKHERRAGDSVPLDLLELAMVDEIPEHAPIDYEPFVLLEEMGLIASTRRLGGEPVKWLLLSNVADASHSHEDKGSFVLEFAGEEFALDAERLNYSDPKHHDIKQARQHNLLVPFGVKNLKGPDRSVGAKPQEATGDRVSLRAVYDLTQTWPAAFKQWRREFDSPAPDTMTMVDAYELEAGDGVDFLWQTRLPVEVSGQVATVSGERGEVEVTVAEAVEVSITKLDHLHEGWQRVAFRVPGKKGTATTRIRLRLPSN